MDRFNGMPTASWGHEPFCPDRRDAGPTLRFMENALGPGTLLTNPEPPGLNPRPTWDQVLAEMKAGGFVLI